MTSQVNFKKGRLYHITWVSSKDRWLVGRFVGVVETYHKAYAFEPMVANGPVDLELENETEHYEFDFHRFPYVFQPKQVNRSDLPLFVCGDYKYPLFEQILKGVA